MNEAEIRTRIKSLEERLINESSWLGYNSSNIDYQEYLQKEEVIKQIEKELKELYDTLGKAKLFPDKKFESTKISSKINENNYGKSGYSAIDAQEQARNRFYGMSKLKQSIAKITGKKKKFEALANKAYDSMTPQEEQKLASEIGRMFR